MSIRFSKKKPDVNEYILYDSIYAKFKDRSNYALLLKVIRVLVTGREHNGGFWGASNIVSWSGYRLHECALSWKFIQLNTHDLCMIYVCFNKKLKSQQDNKKKKQKNKQNPPKQNPGSYLGISN